MKKSKINYSRDKVIYFDVEVFRGGGFLCVKEKGNTDIKVIESTEDFLDYQYEHQDYIGCGGNNKGYDNYILKEISKNSSNKKMYNVSQLLMNHRHDLLQGPKLRFPTFDIKAIMPGMTYVGLKRIEFSLGMNVNEQTHMFDREEFTDQERESLIEYCKHDVRVTERFYEQNPVGFNTSVDLCDYLGLDYKELFRTYNSLLGKAGDLPPAKKGDDNQYKVPERFKNKLPKEIGEPFEGDNYTGHTVLIKGVPHVYGLGGTHGCNPRKVGVSEEGDDDSVCKIWYADVGSGYPKTMENNEYFPRGVKHRLKDYVKLLHERLVLKKENPLLANSLKLMLNSVYGQMRFESSKFYDPLGAMQVTTFLQLALSHLAYMLPDTVQIIQSNTDGVMLYGRKSDIQQYIDFGCEHYNYDADLIGVGRIYQKDVNNYIIEYPNGKISTKGAGITRYGADPKGTYNEINNNIVHTAIVDFIMYNVPVEETIQKAVDNKDYIRFQMLADAGRACDMVIQKVDGGNAIQLLRTNRVFATKDKSKTTLFKRHAIKRNFAKIPNLPEHCVVFNDDIGNITDEIGRKLDVDLQFYIDDANKKIKEFLNNE